MEMTKKLITFRTFKKWCKKNNDYMQLCYVNYVSKKQMEYDDVCKTCPVWVKLKDAE